MHELHSFSFFNLCRSLRSKLPANTKRVVVLCQRIVFWSSLQFERIGCTKMRTEPSTNCLFIF